MAPRDPFPGAALRGAAEPGPSLPLTDRLAPPPDRALVVARVDAHSGAGDAVLDPFGRGGWVARAAVDRERRGITLELGPLHRLLADLVLRPPDLRHLDAAFQALGSSPRGETSLRLSIATTFATACATCGRSLVADEIEWQAADPAADAEGGPPRPVRKHYRCAVCRDQRGGGERREAALDEADLRRAGDVPPDHDSARSALRARFPAPPDAESLIDALLDLHTPRQLVALHAILERIEGDLRAAPILAALRLAFAHTVLPASRLGGSPARPPALRIANGRVRRPADRWRERNPWPVFEESFRLIRAFLQRLEAGPEPPILARLGEDLRSLAEGSANAIAKVATPAALGALEIEATEAFRDDRAAVRPRIRLVVGQPPPRPTAERFALEWHATAWALGRDAAQTIPTGPLVAPSWHPTWSSTASTIRRSLDGIDATLAPDARVVLLPEPGSHEALVAAALGGVGAGYRLVDARLADAAELASVVELALPGAPGTRVPRTRANVPLPPLPGGTGDAESVPARGLFSAPERVAARPFTDADAARTVTDVAVDVLRARGEPASADRLVGEILVGLDRAGQLRRLLSIDAAAVADAAADAAGANADAGAGAAPAGPPAPADPVERVAGLIRVELGRPDQRRLVEIEPGRWWLADRADRATAAPPLADRLEWAVYSILSTAGPLSEAAFLARIGGMFQGHDLPDEALVRACLDSYRERRRGPVNPEAITTSEHLLRRSAEHAELLAGLADAGHRLGMRVWLARREHGRTVDGRPLVDRLDDREAGAQLGAFVRGGLEEVESVDCIWYVRGRATLMFEVEWTAMVGDLLLQRHARIPQEDHVVRFLVIPPERADLLRFKLDRSPLLREALDGGNWHVLKWDHLRAFLARDPLDLADLEPYLGLDPVVERSGEQLPLFAAAD